MLLEIAYDTTHPPRKYMHTKANVGETKKGLFGKYYLTMYLDKAKKRISVGRVIKKQKNVVATVNFMSSCWR